MYTYIYVLHICSHAVYEALPDGLLSASSPGTASEQREISIQGQLLSRNVKRFRGGIVFKAHRLVYHSTLSSRATKKQVLEGP